jgi:hypothetical protein
MWSARLRFAPGKVDRHTGQVPWTGSSPGRYMSSKFLVESESKSCTACNFYSLIRDSVDLIIAARRARSDIMRKSVSARLATTDRSCDIFPNTSIPILKPVYLPLFKESVHKPIAIGFKFPFCFVDGFLRYTALPELAKISEQLTCR